LTAEVNGTPLSNGNYWVDPNAGSEVDAIEVYCNFKSEAIETCVYPLQKSIKPDTYARGFSNNQQWWSEMDKGNIISYDPPINERHQSADYTSQVTFLRLLSTHAKQTITYTCNNHSADVQLRGTGDAIFDSKNSAYKLVSNTCGSGKGNGKAVIEIVTSKTSHMPIRDISSVVSA